MKQMDKMDGTDAKKKEKKPKLMLRKRRRNQSLLVLLVWLYGCGRTIGSIRRIDDISIEGKKGTD